VRDRVYVTTWGGLDRAGVPTGNGRLSILDARTGAVRHVIAVGVAPRAVAVEAGGGRIVVVDGGGTVHRPQSWTDQWTRQVEAWLPWLDRTASRPADVSPVPGDVRVIDIGG